MHGEAVKFTVSQSYACIVSGGIVTFDTLLTERFRLYSETKFVK